MDLTIRQLTAAEDLTDAVRLLGFLNPDSPPPVIRARLEALMAEHPHYQLYGAFRGDRLAGVAGAWIATKVWCGKYLEIDNLVVDPELRGSGIGGFLIEHLEKLARAQDCKVLTLDSYAANHASHRLYRRFGFEDWSIHFIKPLGDWSGRA
jgi:GNAT superfamily N-acetyltransferase